jgi:hypothetical protein
LQFEVDHSHEARKVVNLETRTCGCGCWYFNGIPCPQAITAIYRNKQYPESYANKWYLMETYRLSNASDINTMPEPNE